MSVREVPLVQLGVGGVGRALLRQILENRARHAEALGVRFLLLGLADRDGFLWEPEGLPDGELARIVEAKAQGGRLRELGRGRAGPLEPERLEEIEGTGIVVDVTASEGTLPLLLRARGRGWGIVLANKLPLTASYEAFRSLASGGRTRFETTVAAALPVISTLQTFLLDTGDRVRRIRGCVSGTLNLVCERLERGERLSAIVTEARAHGHTEPDPREDLSGRDAARKALILARLLGYPLELSDVEAEGLYPAEWDALGGDEFLARLPELDEEYRGRAEEARARGQRLRYVMDIEEGRCRVGLKALDPEDELLRPGPADSVVAFYTERYGRSPLIVRGKGSGPELTASGVLADLLELAQRV